MIIQTQLNDLTNRRMTIEKSGQDGKVDDGKKLARDRVEKLLDTNSFVEIGAFVTQRATDYNLDAKKLPADGVVTGYGTIKGRLVYVYSQDALILGGAIGEMHARKIVNVYDLALKMGAPIIGLLDSAGLRLQESTDALHAFGQIYIKQALASGVIPQITAVVGNCGGGTAVITSLSDFTFMTIDNSKLFVNSPNTYSDQAGTMEEFACAKFNASQTGLVDFVCDNDNDVMNGIRELVELLPANNKEDAPFAEMQDDLNRVSEELNTTVIDGFNGLAAATIIADNQQVFEIKKTFGTEVITAFAKLNGMTVGLIANQTTEEKGRLTVKGLNKVSDFVIFCDAFGLPVITLTDVFGYETALNEEKAGLAKAAAKLAGVFATTTVPKINVLAKRGYGSAYVSFNSKHIGADIVLAWPSASVSMMDAKNAIKIIYAKEIEEAKMAKDVIIAKTKEYEAKQVTPYAAASRGYIDDIIEPAATRKRVIAALEMLYTKSISVVDRKRSTI